MRILIAPDKFKSTLSAAEAARAMRDGARAATAESNLNASFELLPLADGGEGSHDCLRELGAGGLANELQLREEHAEYSDPNGAPRTVPFLVSARDSTKAGERDSHRYLETALAIGLTLPGARDASILERTTRGVGEWLAASVAEHARRDDGQTAGAGLQLHLFLGGSATSDGGFGLVRALGFRFHDANAAEISRFADVLRARGIDPPDLADLPANGLTTTDSPAQITVHVYTDVQNPLVGPDGAARLFGPQKGATPDEVEILEARLKHLGELFETMRTLRRDRDAPVDSQASAATRAEVAAIDAEPLYRRPGAGAAGGLALPLLYWPGVNVRFRSGIDFFLEAAGIDAALRERRPDCIISGEGATDRGSLQGKVVAGLGRLLAKHNKSDSAPPLLIVSGLIPAEDRDALADAGFSNLYDTNTVCGKRWPLGTEEAARRLRRTTNHAVRDFLNRNRPG